VAKPSNGWYQVVDRSTGEMVGTKIREKDTLNEDFWGPIFKDTDFSQFLISYYQIGHKPMIEGEIDVEVV